MVFNQNGIFSKAEQTTTKYGKEKSREELTLALSEVQAAKYEQGLTGEKYDEKLDETVNAIGQIDNDEATVEGHIWQIDRSVPKIIDYIGEDDGIEIRYKITGNETWTKEAKTITANVTVKNNKGALDISSIKITKKVGSGSETDITSSVTINSNGTFALTTAEVSETIFKVSAKNSKGEQSTPRTIKIVPKIDTTAPTLSNAKAEVDGMKIKISINSADDKSGVSRINYSTSPTTVKPTLTEKNTISNGQVIELTAETEGEYTVTFTATDNAGNTTTPGITVGPVTTTDVISIPELKDKIAKDPNNWADYLGKKVDYKTTGDSDGIWRMFYYDAGNDFGDGAGTIYLRRNNFPDSAFLVGHEAHIPTDGGKLMKQLNPAWAKSENGLKSVETWSVSEHCVSWLLDSEEWVKYCDTSVAKYAVGASSAELWCSAHSAYIDRWYEKGTRVSCDIMNEFGYGWKINNSDSLESYHNSNLNLLPNSETYQDGEQAFYRGIDILASPSALNSRRLCYVSACTVNGGDTTGNGQSNGIIVALK